MNKRGFTLIELLVVISIIAVLSSVILAALSGARQKGFIASDIIFNTNIYHTNGDNMLAKWDFDDVSTIPGGGTTALDTSGNGNTLSLPNGNFNGESVDTATYSGSGSAIFFNPYTSTAYGRASTISTYPVPSTVTTWVKITSASPNYIMYYSDGGDNIYLQVVGGKVKYNNDYTGNLLTSTASINDGNWHHVALVEGLATSGSRSTILYIDGKIDQSDTTGMLPLLLDSNKFNIGKGLGGSLDEFRIYKATLASSQIHEIYAEGLPAHSLAAK